ncbi:apoptosis-inducing factor 2 [Microdochium nivale]|nr:apoptosis-inducing factor 2 [Microdochium nivale]
MSTKTVVILGAGFTGLPLAHKLLIYTAPKTKLKVILVSPSSEFYWNLAATRGVIPGAVPDDKLFIPIESNFAHHPSASWGFVLGKATSIDPDVSSVDIKLNSGNQQTITYDQLVIATGSRIEGASLPFKLIGTSEETVAALHKLQERIGAAKSIVVAGAGPTGVETAGELAAHFGSKKEITLINSKERVLAGSNVLPSLANTVGQNLRKLGVTVLASTRVVKTENVPGEEGGTTVLTLSNGSSLNADVYLPLFGIRVNTDFVPSQLLDEAGNVKLEKNMRVKGTKNIWGIGDVGNLEPKQVTNTDAQIIYLADALSRALNSETTASAPLYKPLDKTMVFLSLGPKHGTGQIGGWKLWSWMVNYVKGREIFLDMAQDYVAGKKLRHASM